MKENENNNVIQFKQQEKEPQQTESLDITFSDEKFESEHADLTFKIENFEGPLDLLLHLIKKNKLEIETVKLSEITEQFLEVLKQIDQIDLEAASDFIEVAAILIEIKSKALLPKLPSDEEEEDDPEALLLQRLNEYKLFKETIEQLKPLEDINKFYKEPEPDAHKFKIVLKDMEMDMLVDAFTNIFLRVKEVEKSAKPKEVEREKYTVSDKMAIIKDSLILKPVVKFSELFAHSNSRDEVITIFLAILELLKLQEIKAKQGGAFKDIEIIKSEQE